MYFVITRSIGIAFRRLIADNYIADRFAEPSVAHLFIYRLVGPFGFHPVAGHAEFTASTIDPGGIAVVVIGTVAAVRALVMRRRAPDAIFFLAFVQVANLLFVAAMKFAFVYHLVGAAVLMVPLIGAELERWNKRRAVIAVLSLTTAVNVTVALFRGKEADLDYQDTIMRDVDHATPPNATDSDD